MMLSYVYFPAVLVTVNRSRRVLVRWPIGPKFNIKWLVTKNPPLNITTIVVHFLPTVNRFCNSSRVINVTHFGSCLLLLKRWRFDKLSCLIKLSSLNRKIIFLAKYDDALALCAVAIFLNLSAADLLHSSRNPAINIYLLRLRITYIKESSPARAAPKVPSARLEFSQTIITLRLLSNTSFV